MTGIYCITCKETNEKYIGQSVSIKRRWATHKRELKENKHYNKHLQARYNEYGKNSFTYEILELCPAEKLNEREKFYIKLFDSYNNGFNQDIGGCDIRGENNPMYGIKGKDAPRFKDYILQLSDTGEILNRFESSCEAAKITNCTTAMILKCVYAWQGKNYNGRNAHSAHNFQFIYEQDYYKLLPFHDFSHIIKWKEKFITTKDIDEGALSSDT